MAKDSMPEGLKTVMYWVIGLGIIAFIGLIMVLLFGNLSGNVGFGKDSLTFYNSTVTLGDTLTAVTSLTNRINPTLANIVVTNATAGEIVLSENYTLDTGYIKALTISYNQTSVNISGVLSYDSRGKVDTDNLITNYTTSVVNTAKQFPTVGVILGVAILITIFIGLLVFAVRKLLNVAGGSGSNMGSSSKFRGNPSPEFG